MSGYADDYGADPHAAYHHQQYQQQQRGGEPVSITRNLRQHGMAGNPASGHQVAHQDEYGYDGRYYAEQEAHDILEGDSPVGSDDEVAEQLQGRGGQHGQHGQQYHYEDDLQGEQGLEHGEEGEEDLSPEGEFSDSLSSSPSIPDEDIDFNLVYALHTFLATVDGQASVVKGDKLLLLDDSNSYWWLVRVLKTQAIGYIPAENIETPWERLARLNKHRNVDLTTVTQQDVITGPTSTTAQTRFIGRIPPSQQPHPHESRHPYSKGVPASPSHKDHPRNISPTLEARPASSKAKTVGFVAPTYYAHSASGLTTDDEGEEGDEGEYDEGMDVDEHERGGGFDEDDEIDAGHQAGGEESEFSDEDEHELAGPGPGAGEAEGGRQTLHGEMGGAEEEEDEAARREHWERETAAAMQAQQQAAAAEAQWAREREVALQREQQARDAERERDEQRSLTPQASAGMASPQEPGRRALSPHNLNAQPGEPRGVGPKAGLSPRFEGDGVSAAYSPTQRSPGSSSLNGRSAFNENDFVDPAAPTKKLTATPPIARDEDDDGARFGALADPDPEAAPYSHAQQQLQQSPPHAQAPAPAPQLHQPPPRQVISPTPSQPQRVRGVDLVDPKDPRYHRMLQPTKQAGEDVVYERMVLQQQQQQQAQAQAQAQALGRRGSDGALHDGDTSMNSVDTGASSELGSSTGSTGKRASQSGAGAKEGTEKKRKSGGGILGLFRKKDKKKKGSTGAADVETEPRSSEESARSPTMAGLASRRSGSASPASPRSSADRGAGAGSLAAAGAAAGKRESTSNATAESMFSTDAALRQQELEAKQALFQQYGVQRNPGDVSNTMTPRMGMGAPASLTGSPQEPVARSSTGSNRNSLQLLTHPASVIGNGVLHSPTTGSNGGLVPPQRMRPGSLIGSPSIPGLEVPLLSVMRVFAGSFVESEATFKTVLLNQSTTAAELVKQSMQRFRLVGADLTTEDFFLTVKEVGGEERPLAADEMPLGIFEEMSERAGEDTLPPSVKRSSIGSINSISSNLSLNPAITRLGMNDWSDDSAVKFYLNRRGGPTPVPLHDGPAGEEVLRTPTLTQQGDDDPSDNAPTPTLGSSAQFSPASSIAPSSSSLSTPSYRFAVRLVIHPADLPDKVVFDPSSTAIIPKAVLLERQQRAGGFADPQGGSVSPHAREKIIFFPRNVNVSEVVEAGLDRFGIVDGVVDGGDEVEDRVGRRRSATRVKYSLAMDSEGRETLLNASSKLLEAYSAPPLFKPYDRTSKRRSIDQTLVLGAPGDVQPSDPVFILRRSAVRASNGVAARGPMPQTIDELEERQQQRAAQEEELEVLSPVSSASPPTAATATSQRDIIAAQRAAQRANQRAILSAQKNADQGIDINIPEQGTIRSTRDADNDEVRYSFINQDGTEVDISEIVENEWSTRQQQQQHQQEVLRSEAATPTTQKRPTSRLSRATSAAPSTDGAESFKTAREGPAMTDDEDDEQAINALKSSSIDVDLAGTAPYQRLQPQASSASLAPSINAPHTGEDVLQGALGPRPVTSPVFNESLQERLDRVLARVKEEKARRAASPGGSRPRSYISAASGSVTPSGRLSPAVGANGRTSPLLNASTSRSPSSLSGRRSPFTDRGRDSPSIDQILQQSPRSLSSPPPPRSDSRHIKKASLASISSAASSSLGTMTADQPSTPVTAGSSNAGVDGRGSAFTPASSATSNHAPLAPPQIVYRDDFGYETLLALVDDAAAAPRRAATPAREKDALEGLFGREIGNVHPHVREAYNAPVKVLNDLDAQLDALLLDLGA
ncbi:hypothetical protein JCM10207_007947 [Rhodosporidiobolus poonsookiae]